MRNLILIVAFFLTLPGYATTMCAANDSVAIVLDPSINVTSASGDKESMTWTAQFPYGRISGISACINVSGTVTKNLTHTVDGVTKPVVGGEQTGKYCWVRMTHPVMSNWMFYVEWSSAKQCFDSCLSGAWGSFDTNYQGIRNPDTRRALFGSIDN